MPYTFALLWCSNRARTYQPSLFSVSLSCSLSPLPSFISVGQHVDGLQLDALRSCVCICRVGTTRKPWERKRRPFCAMRRSTRSSVHLAAMLNRARGSGRGHKKGGATLPTQPRTPGLGLAALSAWFKNTCFSLHKHSIHDRGKKCKCVSA